MNNGEQRPSDRLVAQAALALAARPQLGDCPGSDDIVAWHEGLLEGGEARHVATHVAHCQGCNSSWLGLLDSLATESQPQPAAVAAPGFWESLLRPRVFGMATAVLAVLVVGGVLLNPDLNQLNSSLPGYELALSAAAQMRGDGATGIARRVLRTGDTFELLLTPATRTDTPVEVRLYVVQADRVIELSAPEPVVSASGAVLIEGEVGIDVVPPAGDSRLLVVLGAVGELPEPDVLRRQLAGRAETEGEMWRAFAEEVTLHE